MSKRSTTAIGAAVTLALFQQAAVAQAQTQTTDRNQVEEVVVTGIRGSLSESVETKREASAIVDVIFSEDMGKFPDKNAAESLSHVPGVNIDRQFGQGERVSIRGTDPALNRTLLNGQTVASADWFILDSPGRTFNYTLLAPEIVSSLEVYKSPEARIDEGSIGGTVILNTHRPIDLPVSTLRTSLDYAYNDRAKEGKPNYSALYSWKNDADTFGVIVTALQSQEELERHGIETFSYPTAGGANIPTSVVADRSAVFPNAINSALFKQERTRTSGTLGLQLKPSDSFELNLTGLYVKAEYDNYNQSRYAFFGASTANMTSATVNDGLIDSASFSDGLTLLDAISRRSEVETYAVDLKADWRGDGWSGSATIGTTEADGGTQQQYFLEYEGRGGFSYDIGKERASVTFANDPASAASLPSIGFGQSRQQPTHDEEQYLQVDFTRDLGWGPIDQWLFGAKYREHKTDQDARLGNIAGSALAGRGLSGFAGGLTPGNMLDGADANSGLERWLTVDRGALESFVAGAPVVNPLTSPPTALAAGQLAPFPNAMFNVEEEISSAYTQFNFTGEGFRGNLGLRYVMTDQSSAGFTGVGGGTFVPNSFSRDYNDWLPSFNFAMDVADDVVVRLAASRTMARANFADLASFVELDNTTNSGRGGNPNLDPYRASNFDVSAEWYMGNESLLAVTFFYKDVRSFIVSQSSPEQQFDTNSGQVETFDVTRPRNGAGGEIQGSELTHQTRLWGDFGLQANYTYADGSTDEGLQLPFSSKHTINLTPYYDNGTINARLTYGWRSKYFREIGRNGVAVTTDEYAQLDAAFGWRLTNNIELTAQVLNMLDETHYEYAGEESRLLNLYKNGRRFFAGVRFSL